MYRVSSSDNLNNGLCFYDNCSDNLESEENGI